MPPAGMTTVLTSERFDSCRSYNPSSVYAASSTNLPDPEIPCCTYIKAAAMEKWAPASDLGLGFAVDLQRTPRPGAFHLLAD
jgi:hypothetical protein